MTLGAVLMLGSVTGGRGDQLSGSPSPGGSSPGGFSLPDLPADWNWGDLPVRLTASESISYNSNVLALPAGVSATNGRPQGDFYSQSSFGLSTHTTWSGQQFFFDGTFGVLRYLHQTSFDSNVYSFSPGVNWHITSRCSGTLVGFFTRSPSTLNQLVGVGINYQTVTSAERNRKMRDLQWVFGAFQQRRDRYDQLEPFGRGEQLSLEDDFRRYRICQGR